MIVQKYGGSSVGTPEKIKRVAERIARRKGEQIVVVVSAIGDTTDELLALSRKVTAHPHERELDMLLSAGERIAMALLSMALRDHGVEAISFTGSQAGIVTDESHTRARILELRPIRVREELGRGKVVIVAGFQGVSRTKEITTLGRGGSDTTAVAMASALSASRCEVYTDVAGLYSADPRLVPAAKRYRSLPLDLVHEMTVRGAQVMHPRSIEIARERRFPLYVGLAHPESGPAGSEANGTMLVPAPRALKGEMTMEQPGLEIPKIVAVTSRNNLRKLQFGTAEAAAVLSAIRADSVLAHDFEYSPHQGLRVLVDEEESAAFLARYPQNASDDRMASVSLIGYQLQQNPSIAARALEVLSAGGISVSGLTCHPQSITVWFSGTEHPLVTRVAASAVQLLHQEFCG